MIARLLLPLVLTLDAALVAGLWAVLRTPLDIAPITAPPGAGAPSDVADIEGAGTGMTVDPGTLARHHVLSRPLFSEDRRAWVPPPAPVAASPVLAPAAAAEAPAPRLVGIGISGGRARALLAGPDGGETLWVGTGDIAWTWRVRAIAAGSVTLEGNDRVVPLSLHPGGG